MDSRPRTSDGDESQLPPKGMEYGKVSQFMNGSCQKRRKKPVQRKQQHQRRHQDKCGRLNADHPAITCWQKTSKAS